MKSILFILIVAWMHCLPSIANAQSKKTKTRTLVVAQDGSGDYKTIQGAIQALTQNATNVREIFIKNGVYREKIYIEKPLISFVGQSRNGVIIRAAIARDEWRCGHTDDWGVATVNIGASDISFQNLTIENDYGFNAAEQTIFCASDTSAEKIKTIRKDGHQMALRTMNMATRMRAVNCTFRAFGGDTVSPWETDNGMWYFKNCRMEGGVDFYCPRGWAWAEDCEFVAHTGPAAIWHDGSQHEDSKTVLKNCVFKGFDGFMLGRYHRDAQFYLINCRFAANMADKPIYRVPTNNVIRWGERIYYYNCQREGGNDFSWYKNNLPNGLKPENLTVAWVFGTRWNPIKL